jgi:cell division protein FtsB
MQGTMGLWGYVKRAILPAICILLMLYFLSFAIGGPTGVLSWRGFEAERRELAAKVAARAEEKAALQKQVELLDPAGVDPDLADELVRRNLNVVKPDEVIVPLEPEK